MTQPSFRMGLMGAGLALALGASPASAIQEVVLGPRAPSFAAAASAGLGWGALPMPAPLSYSEAAAPQRDPRLWAFSGGTTERVGSFLFNTSSGPSWSMAGPIGFATPLSGALRNFGDFGWTARSTTGVMATENLMFYTSVGQTTYRTTSSIVPLPPGLSLLERPATEMDVRAGFKMELMPGLTFGAEAAFRPATR